MAEVDAELALAIHVVQDRKGLARVGAGEGFRRHRVSAAKVVRL